MSERAIVLIDGEHYAPVVRDALEALPYHVVGALLVGGTEKLRGDDEYGVPLVDALDAVEADLVVDLSDEPCSGRASACSGHPARSPSGCRTSAPTSASTRRRSIRSRLRRSP
jgi:hypothetical protein